MCKKFLGGLFNGNNGGLSFNRMFGGGVIIISIVHIALVIFSIVPLTTFTEVKPYYMSVLSLTIGSTAASKISHNLRKNKPTDK